ncbi:trehalose-phosphatase [uncultured Acinetobacter sp.]|uniref:trehalose-phosphatase n=1 Tax=uncultured Acinetobacter sp. TaxID=165433 RepID=UPI00261599C5|nr:trehalose-phosphatase [uncultured Acinetobacter sp.]
MLYLDIDGTLAEFQLDPKDSFIPSHTLELLNGLITLDIPVILLTGRCLTEAQKLAQGLKLDIAASHGLDIYLNQKREAPNLDLAVIQDLQQRVTQACKGMALRLEYKDYAIALHYREYPQSAHCVEQIAQKLVHGFPDFYLKKGQYVWEIAPKAANKGHAIQRIQHALALQHAHPIFIGDDVTDEDGFAMVNSLGGSSIKVGQGETQASYRVHNIQQCTDFLAQFTAKIIQIKMEK